MENKGHSKLKTSSQPYLNFFVSPIITKTDRDIIKVVQFSHSKYRRNCEFEEQSIVSICKNIFSNLTQLDFTDSQILLYQKGHKDAHVFQSSQTTSMVKAESFNNIYNSVKRSKTKVFDNKKFSASHFFGPGPIIAIEFDYLNCQIVFIASRSEFFPPLQSEKIQFNQVCVEAYCPLVKTFLVESNSDRLRIIKTAILSNPEPFKINTKEDEVWLEKNSANQDILNPSFFYLKENYILTLFNKTLSEVNPTLFHYERISLLGELLNTLRHELCNPLFGIQLYLSLWNESTENPDQKELLQHALSCVNKCNGIILNLDSLFKNNSPREELDIKKFLEDILTVAKSEIRNIPTKIVIDESLILPVKAHGLSLFHIIFNFLINAAQSIKQDSSPHREHKISITVEVKQKNLIINVSDTGTGISKGDLNKISAPFYSTKATGHGIGLNICKMLAQKMGGEITFRNREDCQGAIFSLALVL